MTDAETFPAGWGIVLDPATRRTDSGRVLIGGTPLRVLRLSAAGAELVGRLVEGQPVPDAEGPRRLARRLVDRALAHPTPAPPPPFTTDDVTVVIPVLDDPTGLARTLAALGPVRAVIVVDDGSARPARPATATSAAPASVVRHDRTRGPAAARNTGWRAATTPVVAFVDAEVEPATGWLEPLLAHLGDPVVAAVAPRIRSAPGGAPRWLAAYEAVRSSLDRGPLPGPVRPGGRVPYVPTAALVVRRAALEDVGGFDEDMRVGEDVDLVWRLGTTGAHVRYEPAAEARHPCRPTAAAWLRQRFRYGASAAALAGRHGRAVAPLRVSGWSALAWGAVVSGHPILGAATAAGTTAALAPKLHGLEHPVREAVRIAGLGNLWAGRSVADALRRPWWPLTALLVWRYRPARPAVAAAAVVPGLLEWREQRGHRTLGLPSFATVLLLDDLAYGAGVWFGCLRARSFRALRPAFSGPLPRPGPVHPSASST